MKAIDKNWKRPKVDWKRHINWWQKRNSPLVYMKLKRR